MNERLLQYIWRLQYLNHSNLTTTDAEQIQVVQPGLLNPNQGPDFLNARIKIGNTVLAGTVELHLRTTDWYKHSHDSDKNYSSVILHVVWEHDSGAKLPGNLPVLELKDRVSKIFLSRYEFLMNASSFIPCEQDIASIKTVTWNMWKERVLIERLLRKSSIMSDYLKETNYHWEECFWWLLARNFGMKTNGDAFEAIARSVTTTVLAKHKNQIHQIESILLGQAGLLESDFTEDYPKMLQREYRFLYGKLSLKPIHHPIYFLRMRPVNFPTVRLAQLAMLIHQSSHLFSKVKEAADLKDVRALFDIQANDYWHYHYRFDEPVNYKPKQIGQAMIENLIVNTIIPALFTYGQHIGDDRYKVKAVSWLEQLSPEVNAITKGFVKINIENKNAADSQMLIEMKNEYCSRFRCLDCAIGNSLLRHSSLEPK